MAASRQRGYDDNNRKQKLNLSKKVKKDVLNFLLETTKSNIITGASGKSTTSDLSTFDKLMKYLTKTYPEYSISDFTDALYTYRQEQQTLAGLSLSQIEEGVLNIVRNKYPSNKNAIDTIQTETPIDNNTEESVTAALWSTFKRYREQLPKKGENKNETKEDQCLICLENLSSNKTETFPCHHTFHRNCLEEWFKVERTCPLCRKMLLFNDEFPVLM